MKIKLNKISVKLFFITVLTFTTLLIAVLFAQSYYYNKSYIITKQRQIVINFSNLYNDLNESSGNAENIAKILQNYKTRSRMEAIIFTNNGEDNRFATRELIGYEPSKLLEEAILIYRNNILPEAKSRYISGQNIYSSDDYLFSDGNWYSIIAANILKNGDVLLAVSASDIKDTPGILEKYFVYVPVVGITICVLLSIIFSYIVSKPLIKINSVAKDMAGLDFSKKLNFKGNDELSQLSQNLNILSEKLNITLNDLIKANEKLELDINNERKLEKSRKEFVTNVSHELKTPIAIIKGYGEALKDNLREDKKEHYINQIVIQSENMDKLIKDMLDLSKIESGTYNLQMEDFNLNILTTDIMEQFRISALNKNIYLHFYCETENVNIYADRLKIGQVVINFLDNAIRHTPEGGNIYMKIEYENVSDIRLSIENEGENIPTEKTLKIWERFHRSDNDRNRKTGGTGLGLAISAKILELHHMEYGVRNMDNGVIFYFVYQKCKI